VSALQSGVDVAQLQQIMEKTVASVMGIPCEIIGGGYAQTSGKKVALENNRIFFTNMNTICFHLQNLLQEVYATCFADSKMSISFRLKPSPRLEVSSIEVRTVSHYPFVYNCYWFAYLCRLTQKTNSQELLALVESGLLTTQNAFAITNMILGLDLKQAGTKLTDKFSLSDQYITPSIKAKSRPQVKS
jgi:hypothetical protein